MGNGVTGLVLAGGRGLRMGGVDKALLLFNGQPLLAHALQRLQPQVQALLISANPGAKGISAGYDAVPGASGLPVLADTVPGQPGPLAGVLAGLQTCRTDWLATVPCDSPLFPTDLVPRLLAAALQGGCDAAVACTCGPSADGDNPSIQPVFMLVHRRCAPALAQALSKRRHGVGAWLRSQGAALAVFDGADAARAFGNANTPAELAALEVVAAAAASAPIRSPR